jgi:hypothetical protein
MKGANGSPALMREYMEGTIKRLGATPASITSTESTQRHPSANGLASSRNSRRKESVVTSA